MSRTNPEMPLPSSGSLFPISDIAWSRNIAAFSPLTDERLGLVMNGNAALLPPDDPIRHLATLAERPALDPAQWVGREDEHAAIVSGYISGVCLGAAIWRDHTGILREQGVNVPAAKVEPDEVYLAPAPPSLRSTIFRKLIRPLLDVEAFEHEYEVHNTLPRFLSGANSENELFQDEKMWMTLLRLISLNAAWHRNGMQFLSDPTTRERVQDYMRLGIGDVFRLHAVLNEEFVGRVESGIEYRRLDHFFPDSDFCRDLWTGDPQLPWIELEESDWQDPDNLHSNLEILLARQRQGGFTGYAFHGGKKFGKRVATNWDTHVVADTRIDEVHHFKSGYVLPSAGEQTLRLAGDKRTYHSYTLHENDALILRHGDGRVATLYFPFYVEGDPDIASPPDSVVEIVGLCRLANYIPLKESAYLDAPDNENVQEVVEQVLALQQGQRYGRLGRVVAERAVVFRDVVPALLVPGLNAPLYLARELGEDLHWNQGQIAAVSIALAAAIYLGMGRLAKKCLLPRPDIESGPAPN